MTKSTENRWFAIARALFARNLKKYSIKIEDLEPLAQEAGCTLEMLWAIIPNALKLKKAVAMDPTEEKEVMLAVIKLQIKKLNVPFADYKHQFESVAAELNEQNPDLDLKAIELLAFCYPIYQEVLKEIFERKI